MIRFTGLDQRPEKVRLTTLRSIKGKESLQVFLNLNLYTSVQPTGISSLLLPKTNVVNEWYCFSKATQGQED